MALPLGRVAPGTAYVIATDAITITPTRPGVNRIAAALDTAAAAPYDLIARINSVDIVLVAAVADSAMAIFELPAGPPDTYTIRFSIAGTILYLQVNELEEK